MSDSSTLARVLPMRLENKLKVGCRAITVETTKIVWTGQEITSESRKLNCIYDDYPLGFKNDPTNSTKRMKAQNPLEEIYLRYEMIKRTTYISARINPSLRTQII